MATHRLPCERPYFEAVRSGAKQVFQPHDRAIAVGDVVVLREWTPDTETYTGEEITVVVTHRLEDATGRWLRPGVDALSVVLDVDVLAQDEMLALALADARRPDLAWQPYRLCPACGTRGSTAYTRCCERPTVRRARPFSHDWEAAVEALIALHVRFRITRRATMHVLEVSYKGRHERFDAQWPVQEWAEILVHGAVRALGIGI